MLVITKRTGALADRADLNIAVIDVPGYMVRIIGATAGKAGHSPSFRRTRLRGSR
jgi:hypothetical protein